MAYSPEQWEKAKALFESGQFSLSEISEKIGISKSKISEKSKKELWERGRNADYIEAKKTLAVKKGTEKGTTIQILDDIAEDQIRRSGLVYGILESALKQSKENIDNNSTVEKIGIGGGMQAFEKRELRPEELKAYVDTAISAGKAWGIVEDKPQVSNNNYQQNNATENRVVIFKKLESNKINSCED